MLKHSWMIAAAVVFAGIPLSLVQAEQYVADNGKVIHNRLAPVLLHRAVPPFRGQHVYERSSRRPTASRPMEWEEAHSEWYGEGTSQAKPNRLRSSAVRLDARAMGY